MSDALLDAIKSAFRSRGWQFEPIEGQLVVESIFEAHHTRVRVHAQAFPEINAVSVVGYAGSTVPLARAGVVAEMLMRLNQLLTVGNFEMDYDAGTVFFRAANLFVATADPRLIAGLVHSTVAEIDRLTPFLTLVLRMNTRELSELNLKLFLQREDLLPPVDRGENAS
ncbi:MAG: YbjN domain-containing protein [Verrucomicrobiales bacterium]